MGLTPEQDRNKEKQPPPRVAGVVEVVTSGGNFILLMQRRGGKFSGKWEVPGGSVEEKWQSKKLEKRDFAFAQEVFEESGINLFRLKDENRVILSERDPAPTGLKRLLEEPSQQIKSFYFHCMLLLPELPEIRLSEEHDDFHFINISDFYRTQDDPEQGEGVLRLMTEISEGHLSTGIIQTDGQVEKIDITPETSYALEKCYRSSLGDFNGIQWIPPELAPGYLIASENWPVHSSLPSKAIVYIGS